MAKAEDILNIARGEIGTRESPANSNRQKYGVEYGWNGVAWCAIFVWWCFAQAGADKLLPIKTASCSVLMGSAKSAGLWVTSGYQPGDVLIYNVGTSKKPQYHTGICESASGTTVTAIEGNTGIGNDANGGMVMHRTRKLSLVVGAVRPKYDAEKPLTLVAQEALDGAWGNGDVRVKRLTEAGYDAKEVQRLVNLLYKAGIRVQVTVSSNSTLSIREKPDVNSKKLDVFGPGVIVYVEEVREGPGATAWGRVGNGWISMDYVREVRA